MKKRFRCFYEKIFGLCEYYAGQPPSQEFPAVPWGPLDFHCERALNSWTDPLDLNAGWVITNSFFFFKDKL